MSTLLSRLARPVWTEIDVDAPAARVWELLTDVERWPEWGPSIQHAELDGPRFETGATGTVGTVLGVRLPFEVTAYEQGRRWSWKVAGVPATDHLVTPLHDDRCTVGFGVPVFAVPYLPVCRVGVRRLADLANRGEA
jgi:uncharacterized protein YndB with AHSA1/START domain